MDPIDETTDGPDVLRARQKVEEVKVQTDEVAVIIQETRRLSRNLVQKGRKNHFTDKLRVTIQGGTAA